MLEKLCRRGNPLIPLVGMQVGAATLGKSVEIPQKIKNRATYDLAIALLGIYPKDTDVVKREVICTPMFKAAMVTVTKLWKEPRCPSTDEWMKKIWSIYTMEYYTSIRKDEYPTFVPTWTGLEEIMLSEISQAEKVKYHMVSVTFGV